MEASLGAQGLEFKWGKKRGVGGKKKDVQFYESFTFDGAEYYLYDCVLVDNANEPESPYVGKIIKIWEHTNKHAKIRRQVKLLWFFRPSEISSCLEGVPDVLVNELFLASGEGLGLANVNYLEAIGGKCSVLCISKDKRNPQPSDEEIKSTDFVFHRAFDVGSRKVLDTIDEKIAGVDVKFIFNRAGREKEAAAVQEIEADVYGNPDSLKPNGLDNRPQKKQKLDGSVTVSYERNTNGLQNICSDGKTDTGYFKRPRDKVAREEVPPEKPNSVKKQDLGVSVCEGKVTKTATEGLSKKPSFNGKLLPDAEGKLLAADNERNYQVIEVSRRPNAVKSKWFQNLPWEEDMREAEEKGTLVLLQNLDPTYTSDEVEDIVYSSLNEQCRARMIECTSVTLHHIGQALVIFKSREAAESAIERLDEGCLLLPKGRPLVADFAKINPPGKPSPFSGHIKLQKTQMRRETREAVATSHCSQPNNLEFEMALEWCLLQAKSKHAIETISKRQLVEEKSLRINFKPKLA